MIVPICVIAAIIYLYPRDEPAHDPRTCVPCCAQRLRKRGMLIAKWRIDGFTLTNGQQVDLEGRPR